MSDWADGVFSAGGTAGGSAVLSKLLGSASIASPWTAAAGALGAAAGSTATSASSNNKNDATNDNSGWNVNFGGGSITSSATRESMSQWIGIAAGVVTILVALKLIKG
ncbi:MAG TPA: hypothetical protein VEC35_23405 [Noviherbaspirillum sp.]|nr:hypothetical protein [Noviherbaspirillum sp.]